MLFDHPPPTRIIHEALAAAACLAKRLHSELSAAEPIYARHKPVGGAAYPTPISSIVEAKRPNPHNNPGNCSVNTLTRRIREFIVTMEGDMISRRDFLSATSKIGLLAGWPVACGATIRFACAASGSADSPHSLTGDIVRNAPKARYWISTEIPGMDCGRCHESVAG